MAGNLYLLYCARYEPVYFATGGGNGLQIETFEPSLAFSFSYSKIIFIFV